jgi:hypothetical protein
MSVLAMGTVPIRFTRFAAPCFPRAKRENRGSDLIADSAKTKAAGAIPAQHYYLKTERK